MSPSQFLSFLLISSCVSEAQRNESIGEAGASGDASGAGQSGSSASGAGSGLGGAAPAGAGANGLSGSTASGGSAALGDGSGGVSGSATNAGSGADSAGAGSGVAGAGRAGRAGSANGGARNDGGAAGSSEQAGRGNALDCSLPVDENPFGCELAWGANGDEGTRTQYLDFITTWVGYETNGGLEGDCEQCALVQSLASSDVRVGYYAYFIGFQANLQGGFGDCNTDPDEQNLCTGGAQWIRDHRAGILEMYANYARLTYAASPDKGVFWLLEGDFIQYTRSSQSNPLTLAEAGTLTADITCAIKANAPNALVAMDHSTWNSDEETDDFWQAMPLAGLDFVWTTGAGNANGYFNADTNASSYNARTANYAYLFELTGKRIFVDTSFGASQQSDSWSDQSASTLNERVSAGVFAVNVTSPPSDAIYSERLAALAALGSTCD